MKCRYCHKTQVGFLDWLFGIKCFPCYVIEFKEYEKEINKRWDSLSEKIEVKG